MWKRFGIAASILFTIVAVSFVVVARQRNASTSYALAERSDVHELPPCPDKPNCVCSTAEDPRHKIEPIALESIDPDMSRVRAVVEQLGGQVVKEEPRYLRAEFRSRILGFIDDVEFVADDENATLHFRSASRVGYSDLDANRKRMERFRNAFVGSSGEES